MSSVGRTSHFTSFAQVPLLSPTYLGARERLHTIHFGNCQNSLFFLGDGPIKFTSGHHMNSFLEFESTSQQTNINTH